MYKISILGCGWLGSKIANYLVKGGYTVSGSTKSNEKIEYLRSLLINPYIISIDKSEDTSAIDPKFFDCDALIISLTPNRCEWDDGLFENQINVCTNLAKAFGINQVIFISSTSVYGNHGQIATELDELKPGLPSGISLKNAESNFMNSGVLNPVVLRLGGLIGYDRNPFEAVLKQKSTGNLYVPVNLVHADDVACIIEQIIIKKIGTQLFNVVCDHHPLRIKYYQKAFEQTNSKPVGFDINENASFKIVDNSKIKNVLGYEFRLKNPLDIYTYSSLLTLKY